MRHDRHFVDELTQRMGEGIGRMIRVTAISSNQDQPRATLGDLDDLVSSVSKHGVLEPLLVRRRGETEGYELVSGERRFHAAMEVGLSEVPCIELDVTDQQALEIALVENLQRQDLTAFEEADGFRTLIDKYGYTHEQVAEAVGRSRVTVTEALKLLVIPTRVRDLCRHADITAKGILLEIARLPDEAAMEQLIEEIVEERLDRASVRRRRHELEGRDVAPLAEPESGDASASDDLATDPGSKPFVVRFRSPDRTFSVSVSFRTESEPDTREVIAALEDLIAQLRQDSDAEHLS
jgi:ParB family chromosome partitioning protein